MSRSELEHRVPDLGDSVFPAGGLWIAWYQRRSSGVATDLTEDVLRQVAGFANWTGMVDNKVCAVNDVWSGLRFVWRKEMRSWGCKTGPAGSGWRLVSAPLMPDLGSVFPAGA